MNGQRQNFGIAEANRRIANMVRVGRIASVDGGAARAVVDFGDVVSPPLPFAALRAGALQFFWAPQPGEQVLVTCPHGDIAQGVIACSIFAGNATSSDTATPSIDLAGGTMAINGTLQITGNVLVDGDVIASGISLVNHLHPGVMAGGAVTGKPV